MGQHSKPTGAPALSAATRSGPDRPVIGSDYRPAQFETRTPTTYSALRPRPSPDDVTLQRALLADAHRRAIAATTARDPDLHAALIKRLLFDLHAAFHRTTTPRTQTR